MKTTKFFDELLVEVWNKQALKNSDIEENGLKCQN